MPKKSKKKTKPTSGFITRTRIIITTLIVLIAGSGFTVYALSAYQVKLAIHTDAPTVQTTDNDKTSGTSTTKASKPPTPTPAPATPPPAAPAPTPTVPKAPVTTPAPDTVVTPAPTSNVPSLTPTGTGSNSTTSYQSTNWAGYISTSGTFTAVSGTWVAPQPTATSATVESGDGTWVGIGGITTSDLIQVGTQNTISPSGVVSTSAFYELLPAGAVGIVSVTISPGDTITASVTQTSANQWAISLTNVTTGRSFSKSVSYASSLSSAEWIQEDPSYSDGSLVLLDNFGTVQFSNATTTVNGVVLSAAASNASQITLVGQGGASGHSGVPSSISGGSFTIQYR